MKLFLIRYTKMAFTWLRLYKFFNLFSGLNLNLYYMCKLSAWIIKNKGGRYNDFPSKWSYDKRYPMYQWVMENEGLENTCINYLEFGVAQGQSFRWFLSRNRHPETR